MSVSDEALGGVVCSRCGRAIECCSFCDETGCRTPVCYACLTVALGQVWSHPHAHDG
jgi:hypothetical protein